MWYQDRIKSVHQGQLSYNGEHMATIDRGVAGGKGDLERDGKRSVDSRTGQHLTCDLAHETAQAVRQRKILHLPLSHELSWPRLFM